MHKAMFHIIWNFGFSRRALRLMMVLFVTGALSYSPCSGVGRNRPNRPTPAQHRPTQHNSVQYRPNHRLEWFETNRHESTFDDQNIFGIHFYTHAMWIRSKGIKKVEYNWRFLRGFKHGFGKDPGIFALLYIFSVKNFNWNTYWLKIKSVRIKNIELN